MESVKYEIERSDWIYHESEKIFLKSFFGED